MNIYEQINALYTPDKSGYYDTNIGIKFYSDIRRGWFDNVGLSDDMKIKPNGDIEYWFLQIRPYMNNY